MAVENSPGVGVVIVAYNSGDVIEACVESVLRSNWKNLRVVVVDNASPDDSVARVEAVAERLGLPVSVRAAQEAAQEEATASAGEPCRLTVLRSPGNLGFAGGVNLGLKALLADDGVDLFWVLNPDCVAPPDTIAAYVRKAAQVGAFGLMSGRTLYHSDPPRIQSDGGRVNLWTGICTNVHQNMDPGAVAPPDVSTLDFFTGANMIASRRFLETVGCMPEEYFLYFEEVDWALQRGELPLVLCPDAIVRHHVGTSIGSGSQTRRPSPFANYFNYRNRLLFVRRNNPVALPVAYLYSLLKVGRLWLQGDREGARGAFFGLNNLRPPADVRSKLPPETAARAFPGHGA